MDVLIHSGMILPERRCSPRYSRSSGSYSRFDRRTMHQRTTFLPIVLAMVSTCMGQGPALDWVKNIGGPAWDACRAVAPTSDGGSIVVGYTESDTGDVSGNHGGSDVMLVRLDPGGEVIWQRSYGGSGQEEAYAVLSTADGGSIFVGCAESSDGDLTQNHGGYDLWVVRTDADGDLLWQRSYGGSGGEYLGSIVETPDGGYLVTCHTNSDDGDVQGWHAGYHLGQPNTDVWVLRLDPTGGIVWSRCLGGSRFELSKSAAVCHEGGFIIGCGTSSPDGDVVGYHYSADINDLDAWLVKLNSEGAIVWSHAYGGTGREQYTTVREAPNGDLLFSGSTNSADGDVSQNNGDHDVWVVRTSATGELLWERCYGGPEMEVAYGMVLREDGRPYVIGTVRSDPVIHPGSHEAMDAWFLALDAQGNVEQEKFIGGSANDSGFHLCGSTDQSLLLVGSSYSADGDIPNNQGDVDGWVAHLDVNETGLESLSATGLFIAPTIATDRIIVSSPAQDGPSTLHLFDMNGRRVRERATIGLTTVLDVADLPRGPYVVSMTHAGNRMTARFTLE